LEHHNVQPLAQKVDDLTAGEQGYDGGYLYAAAGGSVKGRRSWGWANRRKVINIIPTIAKLRLTLPPSLNYINTYEGWRMVSFLATDKTLTVKPRFGIMTPCSRPVDIPNSAIG
jgi:hypothetical protein